MTKEDAISFVVYLIMIALAIIAGSIFVGDAFVELYHISMNRYLFTIIVIVLGILLNVVGLEVAHMIGAKMGGYKIESVNVLGVCFEKKDDQVKVSTKDFDGLTGETKISPNKEKTSLKPFIWVPLVAYAMEFALMMVLYSIASDAEYKEDSIGWIGVAAVLFIIISSLIALYNIVPLKLDSMNDGYRMVLISKPENEEAFNELMRVENLARENKKIDSVKVYSTITNFTASVNLLAADIFIEQSKIKEAEEIVDNILNERQKLDERTWLKTLSQKLYILLMKKEIADAKNLYQKEGKEKLRRYINGTKEIQQLRTALLVSSDIEESDSEVRYVISKKKKALELALPTFATNESILFDELVGQIKKDHKDWEL